MRGVICVFMGNRKINKNENRKLWYIDANNFYVYEFMQILPYKDFSFTDMVEHDQRSITLDEV